jgi:hypothetical protein
MWRATGDSEKPNVGLIALSYSLRSPERRLWQTVLIRAGKTFELSHA